MTHKEFKFMLAPLKDTSDNALRELCFNHGADLTFTEMVNLKGLVNGSKTTLKKIEILNNVPTQIQLATNKEEDLKLFLKKFEPPKSSKSFFGFNFNIGCPDPEVVKSGLGCAMVKRVSKVNRLVSIVKDNGFPCSIKMRLGLNQNEKKKKTYLNLIKGVDADFFVVHTRHGGEDYATKADFSVLPECVATGKQIIANGDIDSVEKVSELKAMGVLGIMIGRFAVRDPSIFNRLKGKKNTNENLNDSYFDNLRKEYSLLAEKYESGEKYKDNVLKRIGIEKVAGNNNNNNNNNNRNKDVMG